MPSLTDDFDRIGLQIVTFQVEAITPPDEVTKLIDQRSGMGAIGDMGAFTQFQAAQAMRDAAQNPGGGGAAATGVGLGAGMAMGQAMANAINQSQSSGQSGQASGGAPAAGAAGKVNFCPNCGSPVTPAERNSARTAGSSFRSNPAFSDRPQNTNHLVSGRRIRRPVSLSFARNEADFRLVNRPGPPLSCNGSKSLPFTSGLATKSQYLCGVLPSPNRQ